MRYIFLSVLLPFCLTGVSRSVLAGPYPSSPSDNHTLASEPINENFYTQAQRLMQQQLDFIARVEQALVSPDANRMRVVRGQLIFHTKNTERFLKRQSQNPQSLCSHRDTSPIPSQLTQPQVEIYCALYASSQELLKLTPVLDQLLSRRGELALVRELPLVSGERLSDPVLAIAPVQRPNLGKPATPFATREPNLAPINQAASTSSPLPIVGRVGKTAIANYRPPVQPAIAPPANALTVLANAKGFLTAAQVSLPAGTQLTDSQETAAALDRFAYGLDPQEPQTYAQFLQLPRTGIFRVLAAAAYQRPLNTLWNRLQPSVSQRYPFPILSDAQTGFKPSLALELIGDRFQMQHPGVDYSFMVDVGDIPLEKLDHKLSAIVSPTREFLLNYQPPQQLEALQVERRRFLTGKHQHFHQNRVMLASAPAKLNHTYLVRSLQFQLPEMILNSQLIPTAKQRYIKQLKQIQSSDLIVAFRPVRQRADGSYTILWRVIHELPAPQIVQL
ncbi:hypothetical protein [Anabaena sp. CA = ATCC 33047]|uniref:hypothetical protein n=1 Tax=Anabaena sp. (strain CA / ATCC 33047) TaxID=52271 RepID=UPI000829E47F|nr:hypothetical protein [Anabaena sp. CA = ATCC 33047]